MIQEGSHAQELLLAFVDAAMVTRAAPDMLRSAPGQAVARALAGRLGSRRARAFAEHLAVQLQNHLAGAPVAEAEQSAQQRPRDGHDADVANSSRGGGGSSGCAAPGAIGDKEDGDSEDPWDLFSESTSSKQDALQEQRPPQSCV